MTSGSHYREFANQQRLVYSPNIPLYYTTIGHPDCGSTDSITCNFTGTYRQRLSTEWSSNKACRPDPPLLQQSGELHLVGTGHIPNYTGFIPGAQFRAGNTFGNDTKDAKRYIRGDYS